MSGGKFSINIKSIGIQFVVHYRICTIVTFGLHADNTVEVLNERLLQLVGRYVSSKAIRVCNKDKPWFDDQYRHAFGLKQDSHLRWTRDRSWVDWEGLVHCQLRANETMSEGNRQFSVRKTDVLMNAQSPHKCLSTLKSVLFGSF